MTKRRALIRRTIFRSFDSLPPGAVDARFVVGAGAGVTVLAEQAAHGDFLLLNGTRENKESGKNLDYFLLVAERMPRRYSWVVKADADSYVVVANLWRELSLLEPADGYFGAHWPWPTLRRRVAPLLPNGTTRGTKAVVSPAALLAARAALAAFSGFVDDGGAAAPEWAFCGPLYALSGDVVRWLGGALGRGASSAAEWLRPPTSLPRGLPFGEDMQAPPALAPHHAHVASPRLASPRLAPASPRLTRSRLASPRQVRAFLHRGRRGSNAYACGSRCSPCRWTLGRYTTHARCADGSLLVEPFRAAGCPHSAPPWDRQTIYVHSLKGDEQFLAAHAYFAASAASIAAAAARDVRAGRTRLPPADEDARPWSRHLRVTYRGRKSTHAA